MVDAQRFPYKGIDSSLGMVDRMSYLPLTLNSDCQSLNTAGLLDTGASVNVLPYELGLQLGLIGENETLSVLLAGKMARFEARAVVVEAQVSSFPSVDLAFSWTQTPDEPLILGQTNFFFEFDVCFFRISSEFEVRPRKLGSDQGGLVRQAEIVSLISFEKLFGERCHALSAKLESSAIIK